MNLTHDALSRNSLDAKKTQNAQKLSHEIHQIRRFCFPFKDGWSAYHRQLQIGVDMKDTQSYTKYTRRSPRLLES
jgi:hypothetical protein